MAEFSRCLAAIALTLALSACVTARLHTKAEIDSVGERCGLTYGELFQDAEEKRLLFMMKPGASEDQKVCVEAWARKNKLKPVFVDSITFSDN